MTFIRSATGSFILAAALLASAVGAQQPTVDYGSDAAAGLSAGVPVAPPLTEPSASTSDSGAAPGDSAGLSSASPPGPPAPPFQLSQVEQQFVLQVLRMWENESAKINTFSAKFDRLEYDEVWGPGGSQAYKIGKGTLSYSKPDKGSFKIDEISRWEKDDPQNVDPAAPGKFIEQKDEVGEHWVCDGKAVFEYDSRNKQLVVNPIPEAMRGQNIVDGPLPFLFGAKTEKMVARYWIRTIQSDPASIRLEAFPQWQADAANYERVEVMLDRKSMQPGAIQVHLPGGKQRHVYVFHDAKVNGTIDAWFGGLFNAPRTPIGWKKVVVQDPGPPHQAAQPGEPMQR